MVGACGGARLLAAAAVLSATTVVGLTQTAGAAARALPPVGGRFDYQIGGAYPPATSVRIVDRDWRDRPAPGRYSICYVNAFQTQPEQNRWWKRHHPHLLLRDSSGRLVSDPGWPGEILLDTSTRAKRARLADVVGAWVDRCAAKGYRAVEPDNLDSFSRSRGALTRADNLALAELLVRRGHASGLAVAQKNGPEFAARARRAAGFDFAIAEECQLYSECSSYRVVYRDHVIEIEYTDNPPAAFDRACAARGADVSVVLRDRDVTPRGTPGYVERWCP